MSERRRSEACNHSPHGEVDHSDWEAGIVIVRVRCEYCGELYRLTVQASEGDAVRLVFGPPSRGRSEALGV